MESVENTANSPETVKPAEDTKPKKERRNRVARCMVCSEEWMAKNGNEKKPSRCPTCKSYNVKWRDECDDPTPGAGTPAPAEEKKAKYARKRNPDGSFAKTPKNETEVKEISEPEKQETPKTEEKPEIPPPDYDPSSVAFNQPPKQQEPDEHQPDELPKLPNIHPIGLVLVIGFIGLVGVVAMFFLKNKGLPQPQKTQQTPAPAARPRNPNLEAALKRISARRV